MIWILSYNQFQDLSLDPAFILNMFSHAWGYIYHPIHLTFLRHLPLKKLNRHIAKNIDELGKRGQQWFHIFINTEATIELISVANKYNEYHGLLAFVLPHILHNRILSQKLYKPPFTTIKEPHLRKAAIMIRLAQQDWDEDEGKLLCEAIVEMVPAVVEILKILESTPIVRKSVMNFLVKLATTLPPQLFASTLISPYVNKS